jgi:hypothetical protein
MRMPYRSTRGFRCRGPNETEKSTDKGKAKEDDKFLLGRSKRELVRAHLICDVQGRRSTYDHVDPCTACARDTDCKAVVSSGFHQYGGYSTPVDAVFGCVACRSRSLNCNYSLQQMLTMGNDKLGKKISEEKLRRSSART